MPRGQTCWRLGLALTLLFVANCCKLEQLDEWMQTKGKLAGQLGEAGGSWGGWRKLGKVGGEAGDSRGSWNQFP